MTNLPKTVQWVLDFLNMNTTPGIFNPQELPVKLKRPPLPQKKNLPNLVIENGLIIDKSTGYQWREKEVNVSKLEKKLEALRDKERKLLEKNPELTEYAALLEEKFAEKIRQNELDVEKKLKSIGKNIIFEGVNNPSTLKDYKKFFLKKGIPPYKGKGLLLENHEPLSSLDIKSYNNRPKNNSEDGFYDYHQNNPPIELMFCKAVVNVRCDLAIILSDLVMMGTETYKSLVLHISHIKDLYRLYSLENKHIIPGGLYNCIANSGIDNQEICSRLKQCPCCGKFWIEKPASHRPKVFCCKKCKDAFHQDPKEISNGRVAKSRAGNKKFQQEEDLNEMIKHLKDKEEYTAEEAKGKAHKWVYVKNKSFKEYKRTHAI